MSDEIGFNLLMPMLPLPSSNMELPQFLLHTVLTSSPKHFESVRNAFQIPINVCFKQIIKAVYTRFSFSSVFMLLRGVAGQRLCVAMIESRERSIRLYHFYKWKCVGEEMEVLCVRLELRQQECAQEKWVEKKHRAQEEQIRRKANRF